MDNANIGPKIFSSLEEVQTTHSWLSIGVFDGVHRGHQEIINKLTAGAHEHGAPAVIITFAPHPASLLAGREIKLLTTLEERAEIMLGLGVDAVINMQFTHELANKTAEEFITDAKRHLGLEKLLVGHDFALGKNRTGNLDTLTHLGTQLGYMVEEVKPVSFDDEVISSTLIRRAISEGNIQIANRKLGRAYSISGLVVPGDGRGRTIGIPTANLSIHKDKMLPAYGVYACRATVNETEYVAVVNIGLRPTFKQNPVEPSIEAHLLDCSEDLYGKKLSLAFVKRIRNEQKFTSIEALVLQIQADIQSARNSLQNK